MAEEPVPPKPTTGGFSGLRWTSTGGDLARKTAAGTAAQPPRKEAVPAPKVITTAAGRPVFDVSSEAGDRGAEERTRAEKDERVLRESQRLEADAERLAEEEGKWAEAFEAWEAAAALTPDRAGPHEGRARAALRLPEPQPRLALRAAGQAAYLDPTSPQAFLTLGRAQLACDEPVLALRSFNTVRRLEPTHATLHEDMLQAEKLVHQLRLQAEEQEERWLEEEAERIQMDLKRKKDRRKAAAAHWYHDRAERDQVGKDSAVILKEDQESEGRQDRVEELSDEEEEEEELEGGYSKEEWAGLRDILQSQGGSLMLDFQRELARKREQDRREKQREREEEQEEEEDE